MSEKRGNRESPIGGVGDAGGSEGGPPSPCEVWFAGDAVALLSVIICRVVVHRPLLVDIIGTPAGITSPACEKKGRLAWTGMQCTIHFAPATQVARSVVAVTRRFMTCCDCLVGCVPWLLMWSATEACRARMLTVEVLGSKDGERAVGIAAGCVYNMRKG